MSREILILRGGEMLSAGLSTAWFATLAERQINTQRLAGVRDPLTEMWAAEAAEAVARARTAVVGSPAVPRVTTPASSVLVDPMTATEAAIASGCRARNITDLCIRGVFDTARKVGGQWQIERAEVLARVDERKAG